VSDNPEIILNLKRRLKSLLKKKGLSSTDLANRLNVKSPTITTFTAEERVWNPTVLSLEKIANAIDVPIVELFAEAQQPSVDLTDIHSELREIRRLASPFKNLPHDISEALRRVEKKVHFDVLREVLRGFGLIQKPFDPKTE
jgi:transcriptional regulator with XRE-family HTH domain